jgi:hypothetical protein
MYTISSSVRTEMIAHQELRSRLVTIRVPRASPSMSVDRLTAAPAGGAAILVNARPRPPALEEFALSTNLYAIRSQSAATGHAGSRIGVFPHGPAPEDMR